MKLENQFPNFKKVDISDKEIFLQILRGLPSYSDFNLLSLLSWNADGNNAYSLLNNNIVIRIKDYLGTGENYSIIGTTKIPESVESLIRNFSKLSFVPKTIIEKLDEQKYKIKEDRDNFDYIISTVRLSKLEGGEYRPMRKYVNNFSKLYPEYELKVLDINIPDNRSQIVNLISEWCNIKRFDSNKLDEELQIINAFMDFSIYFNCILLGLYVKDKLIAFTFNEIVEDNVIMGHFGKANNNYEDSSYFIEYLTSKYFSERGHLLLNHEQDTGIPGLRTTKMTYRPIEFLKKYTVEI